MISFLLASGPEAIPLSDDAATLIRIVKLVGTRSRTTIPGHGIITSDGDTQRFGKTESERHSSARPARIIFLHS